MHFLNDSKIKCILSTGTSLHQRKNCLEFGEIPVTVTVSCLSPCLSAYVSFSGGDIVVDFF